MSFKRTNFSYTRTSQYAPRCSKAGEGSLEVEERVIACILYNEENVGGGLLMFLCFV